MHDIVGLRMLLSVTDGSLASALLAQAPDAIIFADREGIIQLWNRRAEQVFGYTAAEALGVSLDLIIPEASRDRHWTGFARAIALGGFRSASPVQRSLARVKHGDIVPVTIAASIIRNEAGEVRGILAIARVCPPASDTPSP